MADSIITLDVGGKLFRTHIQTLTKYPESLLAVMFSHTDKGMAPMPKTKDEYYFLDVNPVYFELILDYLRNGEIHTKNEDILKGVKSLANYFGLTDLFNELQNSLDETMVKLNICTVYKPEEIRDRIVLPRKILTKFKYSLLGRYFREEKKAESEMSKWIQKMGENEYSYATEGDPSYPILMFGLLRGDQLIRKQLYEKSFTRELNICQLPYHINDVPSNPYYELNIPNAGSIRYIREKYT